ncbi:SIR2 family protein [uncultured Microbacterium sp.]|uniref:SIR2 family protein n=1 Tax=uncultured Microbacterium sp. TaxID=191216 RepID=UPI0028DB09A2|nr:SIR2 family protein [uncultured Microbacterium sp.]
MTSGSARTVRAVLERFGTSFSTFENAFNEGQYALWLGSGISRERVPNLGDLLTRVLEHLRASTVREAAEGEFRNALEDVLRLAGLSNEELRTVDYSVPFEERLLKDRIIPALVPNYSRVLDVPVGDDNPEDYLVWTGIDVSNTYGSPDLEPDVEHYCIALLMLEGLVSAAVTANWDGLLEQALSELNPMSESLVRVAVKPDDFRIAGRRIDLIKVHGCAVRARDNEGEYRDSLVARHSQISAWTEQPQNRLMKKQLESLFAIQSTLMIGLSAQDGNLQTIFAAAAQDLPRSWPTSPPAIVLSEERVETYHQSALRTTYGTTHQGNSSDIKASALLGAYGKPVLLALVLSSLTEKLNFLMHHGLGEMLGDPAVLELQEHLRKLRDSVALQADPDGSTELAYSDVLDLQRGFIARVLDVVSFAMTVFRSGRFPSGERLRYDPLSDRPATQAVQNADYPAIEFGRLGVALALIGRGLSSGEWAAAPGRGAEAADGVVRLVTAQRNARLFFVKDAIVLTQLELEDSFDDSGGDVLIVVADEVPPSQARSPRSRFGRVGKASAGRFSVASNVADTASLDELYEAFKLAGGF